MRIITEGLTQNIGVFKSSEIGVEEFHTRSRVLAFFKRRFDIPTDGEKVCYVKTTLTSETVIMKDLLRDRVTIEDSKGKPLIEKWVRGVAIRLPRTGKPLYQSWNSPLYLYECAEHWNENALEIEGLESRIEENRGYRYEKLTQVIHSQLHYSVAIRGSGSWEENIKVDVDYETGAASGRERIPQMSDPDWDGSQWEVGLTERKLYGHEDESGKITVAYEDDSRHKIKITPILSRKFIIRGN